MNSDYYCHTMDPDKSISEFVYRFSAMYNVSQISDAVIMPSGKIDLIFAEDLDCKFHISIRGLETKPKSIGNSPILRFFSVSFNPIAIEYIFKFPIADLLDTGEMLQNNFWGFTIEDLNDFDEFYKKITLKISSLIPEEIDDRKRRLFRIILFSNGELTVKSISDKSLWSSRQINRYFNQQFGLSLKSYCNILRFKASLSSVSKGILSPKLNFSDQSHFIKEIKKFTGVTPKELFNNENDRFLQLSKVKNE